MNSNLNSLARRTEAWVQEELGMQRRLLALLGEQERATVANDTEALRRSTALIEAELNTQPGRERRRDALVAGFAAQWSVPARALTLASIIERLGPEAGALASLRRELRETVRQVSAAGRHLSALARLHHKVFVELIEVLVGSTRDGDDSAPGNLIAVEA